MHSINLHGPWQLQSLSPTDDKLVRTRYPCAIPHLITDEIEGFCLLRKFHAPTGLSPDQQVFLHFEFHYPPVRLKCNGQVLHSGDTRIQRIEVTDQLESFNELKLEFNLKRLKDVKSESADTIFILARMEIVSNE